MYKPDLAATIKVLGPRLGTSVTSIWEGLVESIANLARPVMPASRKYTCF